jgi:Chromo (CHRromatin Organisation MOdifier) domain
MDRPDEADDTATDSTNPRERSLSHLDNVEMAHSGVNQGGSGNEEKEKEEGEYFEVDKILKEGESDEGGVVYLVRWGGQYKDPEYDSWEPASNLERCSDIVAAWERRKTERAAAQARRCNIPPPSLQQLTFQTDHKRSRSAAASDVSSGARAEKRRKKQSVIREHSDDGSDSDASVGTQDTFLSELRAKHEGTYAWEDASRVVSSSSESDEETLASVTDKERARRKRLKTTVARSPPRRFKSPLPGRRPSQSQSLAPKGPTAAPVLPILSKKPVYLLKRSKRPREPEVSRPALMKPNVDRPVSKPLSLSRQNALRKKRREEPAPDVNAIPVFRPADVLTAAGKAMRSGLGVAHAVGNIDTAISMVHEQIQPTSAKSEKFPPSAVSENFPPSAVSERFPTSAKSEGFPVEPPGRPYSPERRESVQSDSLMDDLTNDEILSLWPSLNSTASPPRPSETSALHFPPVSSTSRALPRSRSARHSVSGDTAVPNKPPPARRPSLNLASRNVESASAMSLSPSKILPTPETRTWTGELVCSAEREPFGGIRLTVPDASTRIQTVPKFGGATLHLEKLVPIHFVASRWLSPEADHTRKPPCLAVLFINNDSEIKLADILQRTQSVGLVLERTCTIVFFNKANERSRLLFDLDRVSNSGAIGVAVLQPLSLSKSLKDNSPVDEVRLFSFHVLTASFSTCARQHTMASSSRPISRTYFRKNAKHRT